MLIKLSPAACCLCMGLLACSTPPAQQSALPAAPLAGEPGNLAGMDASRIRLAFGTPQFVRKDGQMEMWRYDSPSCKAFFFLYPRGSSLAVKHVETSPRVSNAAADSSCLQALLNQAKTS